MPDFVAVLLRPAATMRRVLDQQRYRWWPFVLLAICVTALRDPANMRLTKVPADIPLPAIIAAAVLAGMLVGFLVFYGLSWVAWLVGRVFEGKGTPVAVRVAAAWGLIPIIASAIYRLPLAFWAARTVRGVDAMSCSTAAFLFFFEIVTALWYLYVASNTIAEAEAFSVWMGLATVILTWLSPVVIVIAAVLAMR